MFAVLELSNTYIIIPVDNIPVVRDSGICEVTFNYSRMILPQMLYFLMVEAINTMTKVLYSFVSRYEEHISVL